MNLQCTPSKSLSKKETQMTRVLISIIAAMAALAAATLLSETSASACHDEPHSGWLAGDFHQHTLFTDGSTNFDYVMSKDYEYGLDWWFNSEHGGARTTDGNGHYWDDAAYYPANPIRGDVAMSGGHQVMYRWQSLRDFAYQDVLRNRALYPEQQVGSGLEWNVPSHEHCSTGIVADDASAISAFEFMFDKADDDNSRIGEVTPYGRLSKQNGRSYVWVNGEKQASSKTAAAAHQDAVAGCAWMQEQKEAGLIENGYITFAHVERAGTWSAERGGGYNIESFRDFNNAGPDVCFGFEGAPGHQVNSERGGFGSSAVGGGTYGGAGYYTATLGGLWDAMLGEGRHWYNFASSDYHTHYTAGGDDFFPGEYQKDYVKVTDKNHDGVKSLDEIVDGMRSGNSFHVMGDLVDKLEFSATGLGGHAQMGSDLSLSKRHGFFSWFHKTPLEIEIRFHSPEANNHGDKPVVDHIDLIAGDITGPVAPGSAEYTKATNETTRILARFTKANWHVERDGDMVIHYHVKDLEKSTYFRLRGTNIAPNTPYETDADGNPLADSLATKNLGLDMDREAWADLWFYSNPIFVYVK